MWCSYWSAPQHIQARNVAGLLTTSFYVAGLTGECRGLLTQFHCGLDDHKTSHCCPTNFSFRDSWAVPQTPVFGTPVSLGPACATCAIATSFRDTPMGSQSGAMPRANGNLVICPSEAPTTQIGRHLRQWQATFQGLCGCVFLQSWIGIGFCHDPPTQKRQTAQAGDTVVFSAARNQFYWARLLAFMTGLANH